MQAARAAIEKAMTYSVNATEKEVLYIKVDYAARIERNPEKSLKINEELAQRFPKEKKAHQMLGFKYKRAGRLREAIKEYNRAIALDPNWGFVYNELGYAYAFIGEFEKAEEYLKRFASLSPNEPNIFDSLAELFFIMGRLDDAILNCKKALEIEPLWDGAFLKLAYIYAIKEDYTESLRQFDKYSSIELDPGIRILGLRNKALMYFLLGRYRETLNLLREQIALTSRTGIELGIAEAHELMAFVFVEMGDFMQAEAALQKCLKIRLRSSPEDSLRWSLSQNCVSGFFNVKAGKVETAKEKLRRLREMLPKVKLFPQQIYSYWSALLKGEVALGEGVSGKAIQIFRNAIPLNPYYYTVWPYPNLYTNFIIRDGLARAFYATGDLDNAIAEYKRLITFDAKSKERFLINPKYHSRLA